MPRSSPSPRFFFTATATTEIYTLSLHDALPIYRVDEQHAPGRHRERGGAALTHRLVGGGADGRHVEAIDRKSTHLNSRHSSISYAVFCLKKKRDDTVEATHGHRVEELYALLG